MKKQHCIVLLNYWANWQVAIVFTCFSVTPSLFTLGSARAQLRKIWAEPGPSQQCEQGSARILSEPLSWSSILALGFSHLWLSSAWILIRAEPEPSQVWKGSQCSGQYLWGTGPPSPHFLENCFGWVQRLISDKMHSQFKGSTTCIIDLGGLVEGFQKEKK